MKDAFTALALTLLVGPTFADPWKDDNLLTVTTSNYGNWIGSSDVQAHAR